MSDSTATTESIDGGEVAVSTSTTSTQPPPPAAPETAEPEQADPAGNDQTISTPIPNEQSAPQLQPTACQAIDFETLDDLIDGVPIASQSGDQSSSTCILELPGPDISSNALALQLIHFATPTDADEFHSAVVEDLELMSSPDGAWVRGDGLAAAQAIGSSSVIVVVSEFAGLPQESLPPQPVTDTAVSAVRDITQGAKDRIVNHNPATAEAVEIVPLSSTPTPPPPTDHTYWLGDWTFRAESKSEGSLDGTRDPRGLRDPRR